MITQRWLKLVPALIAAGALSVACSGGSKKKNNPTPTPSPLSVTVSNYFTESTTKHIVPGECAGIELTEANSEFTEDTTIDLLDSAGNPVFSGPLTSVNASTGIPVLVISTNGDTLTVGSGGTYPCLVWPFDMPQGSFDFAVDVPYTTTTGSGTVPNGHLYSSWNFTASSGSYTVTSVVTTSLTPYLATYESTGGFLSFDYSGIDGVDIAPTTSGKTYYQTVRTYLTDMPGFPYSIKRDTSSFSTHVAGADTCPGTTLSAFPVMVITSNGNSTSIHNDYDPAGAAGCADSFLNDPSIGGPTAGDGIYASGKDVAFQVSVPNGQTLVVGAGTDADGLDAAVYLIQGGTCTAAPTTCLAAGDFNGPGNDPSNGGTDSVRWKNTTGGTVMVQVLVDEFGGTLPDGTIATPTAGGKIHLYVDVR